MKGFVRSQGEQIMGLSTRILSIAVCFLAAPAHAGYAGYSGGIGGIVVFGLFVLAIWGIVALFNWVKGKLVAWAKAQK